MIRKFIRKILKEELMSEISSDLADAAFSEESAFEGLNSFDIFGDEDRVVIPMNYNTGAYVAIKKQMELKGYELNFQDGVAEQKVQTKAGEKIRKIKIDKALQKELKNELKKDPSQESYSVRQLLRKDGKALLKKYASEYPELVALTKNEQSESLFKDYYRSRTYTLEDLISAAWGWEIDYQGNTIKSNAAGSIRSIPGMMDDDEIRKIQLAIDEIGKELKEIGFIENGQDNRGDFIRAYDEYQKVGSGYAIIVSKSPIDVLRMSDFQNIQSCHSEGGSFFHCAVQESESGGAVAYLVKKDEIEGVSMMKREIFADKSRGVDGIKPIARLRLRRLSYTQNEEIGQIIVPELRTYGMKFDEFYQTINSWSFSKQVENFAKDENGDPIFPEKYELHGGAYSDNRPHKLLNAWAGKMIAYSDSVESDSGLSELIENIADDIRQNYGADVEWDGENFGVSMNYQIDGMYELHVDSSVYKEIMDHFHDEIELASDFLTIDLDDGSIEVSTSMNFSADLDDGFDMANQIDAELERIDGVIGEFMEMVEIKIREYMNSEGLGEDDLRRVQSTIRQLLRRDLVAASVDDKKIAFEMVMGSDFQKSAFAKALRGKMSIISDLKSEIGRHHTMRDLISMNDADVKFGTNVEQSCFSVKIQIPMPTTMEDVEQLIENMDTLFRFEEELQHVANDIIKDALGIEED